MSKIKFILVNIIYASALYWFTNINNYSHLDMNNDGFYKVPYTEDEYKKIWKSYNK